jgi:hypothetical protein
MFGSWVTANVVLEGALERIMVGELFCDLPLGLYIGELVRNTPDPSKVL